MQGSSKAIDLLVLSAFAYHDGNKTLAASFYKRAMQSEDLEESLTLLHQVNTELSFVEESTFDEWEEDDEFSSELDDMEGHVADHQEGPPANTQEDAEDDDRFESYDDNDGDDYEENSSYQELIAQLEESENSTAMTGDDATHHTDEEIEDAIKTAGGKVEKSNLSKQALSNLAQLKKTA